MKRTVAIAILLLVAKVSFAQLLWEVSGNRLQEKSYIFGTHHLVPVSFLDSVTGVYQAFNGCRNVVGEIIMDDPSIIKKMQRAAVLTSGETLKDWLTEEEYIEADTLLRRALLLGLEELRFFKPAMIEQIYTLSFYEKYFLIDPDFQLDSYFQKVGKKDGKRLFSLETIDEQIALLFDSEPLLEQAKSLYRTLTSTDALVQQMEALNACYLKQDIEALYDLCRNDSTMSDAMQYRFITERNRRWVEQLPKQLEMGSNFIVVGALHLPGDDGLIALLRAKGYKLKPIK